VFAGKTEHLRGKVLTMRRYTNLRLPLPRLPMLMQLKLVLFMY